MLARWIVFILGPTKVSLILPHSSTSIPWSASTAERACRSAPVEAIFPEDEVPEEWLGYTKINADHFEEG